MNDFALLDQEYEAISTHFTNEIGNFDIITTYYQSIYKAGRDFYNAMSKAALERSKAMSQKKSNDSDIGKLINEVFDKERQSQEAFMTYMTFLDEKVIKSIEKYRMNLCGLYTENLSHLKKLFNEISIQHEKVINLQNCYNEENIHLNTLQSNPDPNEKKQEKAIQTRQSIVSTANKEYKEEIEISKQLYEEFEFEYNQLTHKNKEIKESNMLFLKDINIKHNEAYRQLLINAAMPNIFEGYNEENDMNVYVNEFDYHNNSKTRIAKEKYSSYEEYCNQNQCDTKASSSSSLSSLSTFDSYKNIVTSFAKTAGEEFYMSFEQKAVEFYTKPFFKFSFEDSSTNKIQSKAINTFLTQLFQSQKMEGDVIQSFKDHQNDLEFISKFFDEYLKTYHKSHFRFLSIENFTTFAGLLMQMFNMLDLTQTESFDILTMVLFISEWSYCNNTFLCSILGKFNFFKSKLTWIRMIEYRLLHRIQNKVTDLRQIAILKKKEEEKTKKSKGLFNTFSNMFNADSDSDEDDKEKDSDVENSFISEFGFNTRLEDYYKLSLNDKTEVNNDFITYVHVTLKEYISNLCNFNFDMSEGIDLIVEIALKYSLSSDKINLYLTLFNIASTTIRREGNKTQGLNDIKIKEIMNKNNTMIQLKYPSNATNDDHRALLLLHVIHYTNTKDKVALFQLNKTISKKMKMHYYKELLLNSSRETSLKHRLDIWKAILHTESIASNIDYDKTIEDIKAKELEESASSPNVIDLDVARTAFPENVKDNRIITSRLLKCLLHLKPEIRYYQGMNYIAAFMLRMTHNEKESFKLLYGIFTSTEIRKLFSMDLNQLKAFLLIFDRLLLLNLPSLYYYFKEHSVNTNYYVTPWLVTLFTNILQFMKERKDVSYVVLHIWDEFILKGWKALMESILTLIYYHKDDIMTKKEDDLFSFLINDLVKSQCFQDENYDKWVEIKKKIHISSMLIHNINEEINIEHLLEKS